MRIAVYGKGGIGKSTLAANLSAAWADRGLSMLHIGCDPKSDGSRLLLGRRAAVTVLDYLRTTRPMERSYADIISTGYGGVQCIEAGGPEPGVGCAGRGILSMFAFLNDMGLDVNAYDRVMYDVLGDVVCGGFAVPLRREFADDICLVTSGEFMSLYAANNILRGVKNYETDRPRIKGILLNCRGLSDEEDRINRFADAVGLPVIGVIPRSDIFRQAEAADQTLARFAPEADMARLFATLAKDLGRRPDRYFARPLTDESLKAVVRKQKSPIRPTTTFAGPEKTAKEEKPGKGLTLSDLRPSVPGRQYLSKSLLVREPTHGCAFAGALNITTQIKDAVTVVHGPANCTHIAANAIVSSGIRTLRVHGMAAPRQLAPALEMSPMDDHSVIYGAVDTLVRTIRKTAAESSAKAVFVVSTCPSGIIGEDVKRAVYRVLPEKGAPPVIPVTTDGNLAGDYMQGVINAVAEGAAALIDPAVTSEEKQVNIIAEKNIAANTDPNFQIAEHLLSVLGVKVNCRFVRETTVSDLKNFCRGSLNLLAYDDHFGRVLKRLLEDRFGAVFAETPFPVGPWETGKWLMEIASFFRVEEKAKVILQKQKERYRADVKRLRRYLSGKRLMIVSYNHSVDWLLEAARDTGMEVVRVGILNYTQDNRVKTRFSDFVEFRTGYTPDERTGDIKRLSPHLVLSNYAPPDLPDGARYDTLPLCPDVGYMSGLVLARRWAAVLKGPVREGWKNDFRLFS